MTHDHAPVTEEEIDAILSVIRPNEPYVILSAELAARLIASLRAARYEAKRPVDTIMDALVPHDALPPEIAEIEHRHMCDEQEPSLCDPIKAHVDRQILLAAYKSQADEIRTLKASLAAMDMHTVAASEVDMARDAAYEECAKILHYASSTPRLRVARAATLSRLLLQNGLAGLDGSPLVLDLPTGRADSPDTCCMVRACEDALSQPNVRDKRKGLVRRSECALLRFEKHVKERDHVLPHVAAVIFSPPLGLITLAVGRIGGLCDPNDSSANVTVDRLHQKVRTDRHDHTFNRQWVEVRRINERDSPRSQCVLSQDEEIDGFNAAQRFVPCLRPCLGIQCLCGQISLRPVKDGFIAPGIAVVSVQGAECRCIGPGNWRLRETRVMKYAFLGIGMHDQVLRQCCGGHPGREMFTNLRMKFIRGTSHG